MKNHNTLKLYIIFFLILFSQISISIAQDSKPKIQLFMDMKKEIEVIEKGKKVIKLVPVEKSKKGDVLVYKIIYRNDGQNIATDIKIVDPIPKGTVYILESAGGKNCEITYSIDNGITFQQYPVKYKEKIAEPEKYTHIKWVINSIFPNKSDFIDFKVKVK
ncbi:MAG: hypothetical protein HQK78_13135 [Desulfobacterales bacterium]|nr:hypothetical protein [Desulfobacterales bacterium]